MYIYVYTYIYEKYVNYIYNQLPLNGKPSSFELSHIYICIYKLITMLQYVGQMGYKYESLPVRKDRYTLLLGSPFLMLKSKMAVFMEGSFR